MTRIAHPKFLKGCIVRASTQAHPTPWRDMQEPQRSGRRRNEAQRRPKQIYRPVPDERGGGLQSEERRVVVKRRHGADLEPCGAATVAAARHHETGQHLGCQ